MKYISGSYFCFFFKKKEIKNRQEEKQLHRKDIHFLVIIKKNKSVTLSLQILFNSKIVSPWVGNGATEAVRDRLYRRYTDGLGLSPSM